MSNNLENYEEKYNQALKRAKEFMTNKGVSPNADAFKTAKELTETIFPELRESEDERIRKELIEYLKERLHSGFNQEVRICNDGISWLEKQGEKKPIIIIPQFKVGDTIKPKPYNEEHLIKDINENGYVLDVDITIPFKDEDVWEIVAQNPAWSGEEDKDYLNCVIATIEEDAQLPPDTIKRLCDWLKSIKDRVQPHPKQEWSEEDEERIEFLVALCDDEQAECVNNSTIYRECTETKDWLKSLKSRVK